MLFLLDQNFPDISLELPWPPDIVMKPLRSYDARLTRGFEDWQVVRELTIRNEADGFITFDARMLSLPTEIVALTLSKLTLIVCDGVDNDSLRSTGLLMVYLPKIVDRLASEPRRGQVVILKPSNLRPKPADQFLPSVAFHRNEAVNDMLKTHRQIVEEYIPLGQRR